MDDTELTGLTATTAPVLTDFAYVVTTPGGTPASHYATLDTIQQLLLPKHTADGRLTLTTATPVTTSDVSAATTLYYTPHIGNKIGLYDGTKWNTITFAELSITNAGLAASKPYDVFCYNNSGTATLELLVWTNDTTRATALAYQDGVLVKSGAATRRFLGTIYTDSASKFNDGVTLRHVSNFYNRVTRTMRKALAAGTWTYNVAAYRIQNNDATFLVDWVSCVADIAVHVTNDSVIKNSNAASITYLAMGLDRTNGQDGTQPYTDGTTLVPAQCVYNGYPGIGRHYMAALEYVAANTGTYSGAGFGLSGWLNG